MGRIAAQRIDIEKLHESQARIQGSADLAQTVDDDPALILASVPIPQPGRHLDPRIVDAGDGHRTEAHGPTKPNTQHRYPTGAATSTAPMISSTPPSPGSHLLLSFTW